MYYITSASDGRAYCELSRKELLATNSDMTNMREGDLVTHAGGV